MAELVFNSLAFVVFLPLVLIVYYRLSLKWQNLWLLTASWFFYGWWDYRFLSLILISTVIDYVCSNGIAGSPAPETRKLYLVTSVGSNLALLGMFKYYDFFIDSAMVLLSLTGLEIHAMTLRLILPMGISFYTFQTISYTVDVYRGTVQPCRDPIAFALYVSYFPQLVAGPIERASELLPRIENPRKVTLDDVAEGSVLMIIGFFKKVAVADVVAPYVVPVFQTPAVFSSWELLAGVYLFAIQIYCDFSGYSDIARGTSRWLGIPLRLNFRQPYFSGSITEFWRRWHMSLSSWLKDYLYIPLGGNRKGKIRNYLNLLLTMLLGGLWHGANWTFVVWGGLHGAYLAVHKWMGSSRKNDGWWNGRTYRLISIVTVFHLVCLSWIFFRAGDFQTAWEMLAGIFRFSGVEGGRIIAPWTSYRLILVISVAILIDAAQNHQGDEQVFRRLGPVLRGILYASLIALIFTMGGLNADVPFIYFQF